MKINNNNNKNKKLIKKPLYLIKDTNIKDNTNTKTFALDKKKLFLSTKIEKVQSVNPKTPVENKKSFKTVIDIMAFNGITARITAITYKRTLEIPYLLNFSKKKPISKEKQAI